MKHLGPCSSTAWLIALISVCKGVSLLVSGREALALTSELASLIRAIFHTVHERMRLVYNTIVFPFFKF